MSLNPIMPISFDVKDNPELIDAIYLRAEELKRTPDQLNRLADLIYVFEPGADQAPQLPQAALDWCEALAIIIALHELHPSRFVLAIKGVRGIIKAIKEYRPIEESLIQPIRESVAKELKP